MYSGRIHLRMANEPVAGEPEDDRDEADEAQLPVGQEQRASGSCRATPCGATNGNRPSTTSTSANAAHSESAMPSLPGRRRDR